MGLRSSWSLHRKRKFKEAFNDFGNISKVRSGSTDFARDCIVIQIDVDATQVLGLLHNAGDVIKQEVSFAVFEVAGHVA
ncbi:hypothetical protein D3C72_2060980 [compost metagenome]